MKSGISFSELTRGKPSDDFEQVGKVSAESVLKHTGKNWKQWIALLDKAGADTWKYSEIVAFLKTKHKLTPWWQHGVALGFEIATGRRVTGQDINGKFMVTATKSLSMAAPKVWKFLISDAGVETWLKPLAEIELKAGSQFETTDGFFGEVRVVTKGRRMRLFWQDPLWSKHTVVELLVVPKPKGKTILVFNHTGIAEARTKEVLRARWRGVADRVLELLGDE